MMKLYGSPTSPYVRKVRCLVHEKNLPVEFAAVETAADTRISALNPLGKVPVLQRDDGSVLFDSPVIVEFLDAFSAPALIPATGETRWQVLRMAALADGIMDAAVARMLELRRLEPQRSADLLKHQEGKIARAMVYAEGQLSAAAFLVGGHFSLADIALAAALEYVDLRYPHPWKEQHPRLASWLVQVAERASFTTTQPPK